MKKKPLKNTAEALAVVDGLSPAELTVAKDLQALCPKVVAAANEVSTFEAGLRDRYFKLCVALRDTRVSAADTAGAQRGLNRREVTLLLLSLGYTKQRVTEINRVVEVSDELWAKFEKKKLGFRAVLTEARGPKPALLTEEEAAKVQPAPSDTVPLPDSVTDLVLVAITELPVNAKGQHYSLRYASDKLVCEVRIFIDRNLK